MGAGDADELLRLVLQHTPDFIATTTPDGRFLMINRVVGARGLDQLIGRSCLEFTAPESVAATRAALEAVVATAKTQEVEQWAVTSVGRRSFLTRMMPVVEDGRVGSVLMISTDITRIKDADRSLRESAEVLRLAALATGMGLWIHDRRTGRTTWDETLRRITGIPAGEETTVGTIRSLIHPDDRSAFERHRDAIFTTLTPVPLECRLIRASDGATRWVLCHSTAVLDETGAWQQLLGGVFDVTERRQVEEKLRQAQRMDAVGSMTAGIAHNFNNLLMAVLPSLDRALSSAPPALVPPLLTARDASQRAAALVRDLMLFAGQHRPGSRRPERVAAMVQKAVDICRSAFPSGVALHLALGAPDVEVDMHAGSLEQAVLNVCLNARDAVRGREDGVVRVAVTIPDDAPDQVCIEVTDNGPGLSDEVRRRVFEPFFTTKPPGEGTGLGLSTAYAIVKEHGGVLSCGSAPGGGATFSLRLPRAAARPAARHEPVVVAGRARVLVADDDGIVRRVVATSLRDAGYEVIEATNGADAVATYQRELTAARVDLVLIDDSMPVMSGRDAVTRIRAIDPAAVCVLLTGYGIDASDAGVREVLTKPVTSAELLRCVQRSLAG